MFMIPGWWAVSTQQIPQGFPIIVSDLNLYLFDFKQSKFNKGTTVTVASPNQWEDDAQCRQK